jgi:hypothetical protein
MKKHLPSYLLTLKEITLKYLIKSTKKFDNLISQQLCLFYSISLFPQTQLVSHFLFQCPSYHLINLNKYLNNYTQIFINISQNLFHKVKYNVQNNFTNLQLLSTIYQNKKYQNCLMLFIKLGKIVSLTYHTDNSP